jgi:hypothetical protein
MKKTILIITAIFTVSVMLGIAACGSSSGPKPSASGSHTNQTPAGSFCAGRYGVDQFNTVAVVQTSGAGACVPINLTVVPGLTIAPMTGISAPPPWASLPPYCTATADGTTYQVIELGTDPTNAASVCSVFSSEGMNVTYSGNQGSSSPVVPSPSATQPNGEAQPDQNLSFTCTPGYPVRWTSTNNGNTGIWLSAVSGSFSNGTVFNKPVMDPAQTGAVGDYIAPGQTISGWWRPYIQNAEAASCTITNWVESPSQP